jgi:rod shape-determining protein MreC
MERESSSGITPLFLFLVLFCLFLILINSSGPTRFSKAVFEGLSVPIKSGFYRLSQGFLTNILPFCGQDQGKITKLESQLRDKEVNKVKLKALEEENQALRRQLGAPFAPTVKFLPAKTMGLTRYLEIDKGEQDEVKVGMMVVSENVLVGKVEAITPKTSKVLLPQDLDSKIPGRSLKTNASGLVVGEFGTKAFFDKVLQEEMLEEGDLIVTIGEGGYPRDLIIGKIGKIEREEVQPFQRAEVIPLVDYGQLVNVFLIQ